MSTLYAMAGRCRQWMLDMRLRWMLARIEARLNGLRQVQQAR